MGAKGVQRGPEAIEPRPAAVRPRGRLSPEGEVLPVEVHIRSLLAGRTWGAVAIFGPHGSGKSTALCHVASVLPEAEAIRFVDGFPPDVQEAVAREQRVVFTAASRPTAPLLGAVELASWSNDDLIEYLLARHKDRCSSVMARVAASGAVHVGGSPELWTMVLDELAADERVGSVRAAFRRGIERVRPGPRWESAIARACLSALGQRRMPLGDVLPAGVDARARRLLRHREVQVMVLSDRIEDILRGGRWVREDLNGRLPSDVVREVASRIADLAEARQRLETMARTDHEVSAFAASVLVAADPTWRPSQGGVRSLEGAHLPGARWHGIKLPKVNMVGASFRGADLRGAQLDGAKAHDAAFGRAHLSGASMEQIDAEGADFSGADLSAANLARASLMRANLERANLEGAVLASANLVDADLAGARLVGADLSGGQLGTTGNANLAEADLARAVLANATLQHLDLREANLVGASFRGASLQRCNLEGMELPAADFHGANLRGTLLTGSRMPRADFENANLTNTGLAEIDWEGANLRNADLRGASFHMGSTRSGLVGSTIPSEGSRTGFYTDDYNDRDFKAPEEIRKANLCGADLRGANLEVTDFYLVDLRDALYTPRQAEHLAHCGAILGRKR